MVGRNRTFPYLIGFEQRFVNRVKTWFPIIFSATLSGQASRDSRNSAAVEEAPPTARSPSRASTTTSTTSPPRHYGWMQRSSCGPSPGSFSG